jgi:hypothetical protein
MATMKTVFTLAILLSLPGALSAQQRNLGHIDFPTSAKGEVQEILSKVYFSFTISSTTTLAKNSRPQAD